MAMPFLVRCRFKSRQQNTNQEKTSQGKTKQTHKKSGAAPAPWGAWSTSTFSRSHRQSPCSPPTASTPSLPCQSQQRFPASAQTHTHTHQIHAFWFLTFWFLSSFDRSINGNLSAVEIAWNRVSYTKYSSLRVTYRSVTSRLMLWCYLSYKIDKNRFTQGGVPRKSGGIYIS